MTQQDLQQFQDRQALASFLRHLLPFLDPRDTAVSPTRGGRTAALQTLSQAAPHTYGQSRNFLSGAVTRLSPYLRHGVLTLAEVRDFALAQVTDPRDAAKFINELAWRDYWQRLYFLLGEGIWEDREPYKTGYAADTYAHTLPQELSAGTTTLVCMDSFAHQLRETGYLHNHARLWTAAYLVHWRRVRWQAGALWFLEHLLDGDPASNNLSWQWVASTFAAAPYLFNRENLARYTENAYCHRCPHAGAGTCPFDASYEALEAELFPPFQQRHVSSQPQALPHSYSKPQNTPEPPGELAGTPLLWHHTDSLNPVSPMLQTHANAPAVFLWDTGWLQSQQISLKRIVFLAECLQEMPGTTEIRVGDPATEILAAARAADATHILAQRTPDPRLMAAAAAVERDLPVVWYDPPAFVPNTRGLDLKRFSRYWKRAQESAMTPTAPGAS